MCYPNVIHGGQHLFGIFGVLAACFAASLFSRNICLTFRVQLILLLFLGFLLLATLVLFSRLFERRTASIPEQAMFRNAVHTRAAADSFFFAAISVFFALNKW